MSNFPIKPIISQRKLGLNRLTHLLYLLYSLYWVTGITALIAIIINYTKRSDTIGTIYESHFRWQIKTFWYAFWFSLLGFLLTMILIGYLVLLILFIWVLYRIIKGWIRLIDGLPVY